MRKPSIIDAACYYLFVTVWPLRWQQTRAGMWLLERAGNFAYYDNALCNERMAAEARGFSREAAERHKAGVLTPPTSEGD